MKIPESEVNRVKENLRRQREHLKKLRELPEINEQARIFKNWMAHGAILDVISSVRCPVCEKSKLTWDCCGLSLEDAIEILRNKVPEHAKVVKKAREKAGLKLELIPFPNRN